MVKLDMLQIKRKAFFLFYLFYGDYLREYGSKNVSYLNEKIVHFDHYFYFIFSLYIFFSFGFSQKHEGKNVYVWSFLWLC